MGDTRLYRVTFGYRTDDGLNYSGSTHTGSVIVEAMDVDAARLAAIDAAYAADPHRSHVSPATPREICFRCNAEISHESTAGICEPH